MTGETVCIEAGGADEDAAAARLALLHQLGHPLIDACLGGPEYPPVLGAERSTIAPRVIRLPGIDTLHFTIPSADQPNAN